MNRRVLVLLAAAAVLGATLATPAGAAPLRLRLDGVGPLKLGMSRASALATGWLANRQPGCELAGPPRPRTYDLTGRAAPRRVRGSAEFRSGRLISLSFTRGVRTAVGVTVGTTSAAGMVGRYRAAGFGATARFDPVFGGRFVSVRRAGRQVLGGFARGGAVRTLGVPFVPVCE